MRFTSFPFAAHHVRANLPNRNKRPRALLLASGLLLLILLLSYALRAPLLTAVARFLIVDEKPEPADIIVVPNGGADERAIRAAELFQQGFASRIVIAQSEPSVAEELGILPNATAVTVDLLEALGVPPDSITTLSFAEGVTSTRDEAVAVRRYVNEHDVGRVMLVTSAFHTRRARGIFAKELSATSASLRVVAAPNEKYDATNWWQDEAGLVNVNNEYIKLFFYMIRY